MRARRIKIQGNDAIYHVISKTVNGEKMFGHKEKETLRKMLWKVAAFSGVKVLTYCLMDNHFHVLVRVPEAKREEKRITDADLVERYGLLHPKGKYAGKKKKRKPGEPVIREVLTVEQVEGLLAKGGEDREKIRKRLLARMHDVSEFMRTFKQRSAMWYNQNHDRFGPLWSDRFKSVLVEEKREVLKIMAAYIDLNPVRAGLVADPADYRFCGYGEAVAGNAHAVEGLSRVVGDDTGEKRGGKGFAKAVLQQYRNLLYSMGSVAREGKAKLELAGAELSSGDLWKKRVWWMVDGAVLGTRGYVESLLENARKKLGRRRQPNPRLVAKEGEQELSVVKGCRQRAKSALKNS